MSIFKAVAGLRRVIPTQGLGLSSLFVMICAHHSNRYRRGVSVEPLLYYHQAHVTSANRPSLTIRRRIARVRPRNSWSIVRLRTCRLMIVSRSVRDVRRLELRLLRRCILALTLSLCILGRPEPRLLCVCHVSSCERGSALCWQALLEARSHVQARCPVRMCRDLCSSREGTFE